MPALRSHRPFVVSPRVTRGIGRYQLDRDTATLSTNDFSARLRWKVFLAMDAMISRGGRATRAELAAAVWGHDLKPEMDGNALDQIMSSLRRTLQATRDLRLQREIGEYRLEILDLAPNEKALPLMKGQIFPRSYLLDPSLWIARCRPRELDCLVITPQPLELEEEFGQAAFRHMQAGAQYQMLLPTSQLEYLGQLIHQLIASDLESGGDEPSILLDRLLVLETQLRVNFTDEDTLTGLHLQMYQASPQQNAIAVVVPQGEGDAFVYATGSEASYLGMNWRARLTAEPNGKLMVGISKPNVENSWSSIRRGLCRFLSGDAKVIQRIQNVCG